MDFLFMLFLEYQKALILRDCLVELGTDMKFLRLQDSDVFSADIIASCRPLLITLQCRLQIFF